MNKKQQRRSVMIECLVWLTAFGLMLFVALFSYGEVKETTVDRIQTKITNIQVHSGYRKSWVTFSSQDGNTFYMRTDELCPGGATQLSGMLQDSVGEKVVTIAYTERMDLLPINILTFWPYKRAVQIECDRKMIVSLEDYNKSNRGFLVGLIIASFAVFVLGCVFAILKNSGTGTRGWFRCPLTTKPKH